MPAAGAVAAAQAAADFKIDRPSPWPRFEHAVYLLIAASPLSKPATNIALAVCAVLFVRDWLAGRLRPRATPLDTAVLAWVGANLLSAVTSIDPLGSFRDLRSIGHWGTYYFVAWAVAYGAPLRLLQNVWLAAGGLTAAVAFVQGALHADPLGRDIEVPTGFFGGHLELGHYMVVLFALALARWNDARETHERQLAFTAMLAFGGALVISGGRGPWLALLAVIACWGAIVRRGARFILVLALLLAIQSTFLVLRGEGPGAFYRSYWMIEKNEPTPVADSQIASNAWRVAMWREGLRFFALRPVTGTGVETTRSLSQDFRTPFPDLAVAHLHSNYFEILMTRGFLGLASFFLLLFVALQRLAEPFGRADSGSARAALFVGLAAVVTHLVHGLTHFTVGSSWIQIGFYIGLGLGVGQLLRLDDAEGTLDPTIVAAGLVTIASTIVVTPWLAGHPSLAAALALVALVDCGARFATGRSDALDAALVAAIGFVAVSSFSLLVLTPQTQALGVRVLTAAAAPFALTCGAHRIWDLLHSRAESRNS